MGTEDLIHWFFAEWRKVADPFLLIGVTVLTYYLRPWLNDYLPGEKLAIVPLCLGMIVAAIVEYSTPEFDLQVWMRRTMAYGMAAPCLWSLWIAYGQGFLEHITRRLLSRLDIEKQDK